MRKKSVFFSSFQHAAASSAPTITPQEITSNTPTSSNAVTSQVVKATTSGQKQTVVNYVSSTSPAQQTSPAKPETTDTSKAQAVDRSAGHTSTSLNASEKPTSSSPAFLSVTPGKFHFHEKLPFLSKSDSSGNNLFCGIFLCFLQSKWVLPFICFSFSFCFDLCFEESFLADCLWL